MFIVVFLLDLIDRIWYLASKGKLSFYDWMAQLMALQREKDLRSCYWATLTNSCLLKSGSLFLITKDTKVATKIFFSVVDESVKGHDVPLLWQ